LTTSILLSVKLGNVSSIMAFGCELEQFSYLLNSEYERSLLSKRVKEGMAYAKKQGKKLGRPATAQKKAKEVERLFCKKKMSKSAISKKLEIGYGSVHRIIKRVEETK